MNRRTHVFIASLAALAIGAFQTSCVSDVANDEDDLTSITARERVLTFEGYVYVGVNASPSQLLTAVRAQTRSAFGALLAAHVSVSSRELAAVDTASFVKEKVGVVGRRPGAPTSMLRVHYRYTDRAIMPKAMASKSTLSLGLLQGDYASQAERVLKECTLNGPDEREMSTDVWYVFNPLLAPCKKAMKAEQSLLNAQRTAAGATEQQVVPDELERLYVPMTASFSNTPESRKTTYPEYDRLWAGGVTPGTLTATLLAGMIDHVEEGKTHYEADDSGYWETMATMEEVLRTRPKLNVVSVEPQIDLSTFKVGQKTVANLTFRNFVEWNVYETGWPTGLTVTERKDLERQVAHRLTNRWLTFEEKVNVSVGAAAPKLTTIRMQFFFGAEEAIAPYRRAIRTSDIMLYNGHSYIGEGPLDPANFSKKDFPQSYQLLFIDSCISFNYYNSDYNAFKTNGSADLDLITNGVESLSDGSGAAQGRFLAKILSGKTPSYLELLKTANTTGSDYSWGKDALRVVDGELDNQYTPTKTPIQLTSP